MCGGQVPGPPTCEEQKRLVFTWSLRGDARKMLLRGSSICLCDGVEGMPNDPIYRFRCRCQRLTSRCGMPLWLSAKTSIMDDNFRSTQRLSKPAMCCLRRPFGCRQRRRTSRPSPWHPQALELPLYGTEAIPEQDRAAQRVQPSGGSRHPQAVASGISMRRGHLLPTIVCPRQQYEETLNLWVSKPGQRRQETSTTSRKLWTSSICDRIYQSSEGLGPGRFMIPLGRLVRPEIQGRLVKGYRINLLELSAA